MVQEENSPVKSATGNFPCSHKALSAVFYGVVMVMTETRSDAIATESPRAWPQMLHSYACVQSSFSLF